MTRKPAVWVGIAIIIVGVAAFFAFKSLLPEHQITAEMRQALATRFEDAERTSTRGVYRVDLSDVAKKFVRVGMSIDEALRLLETSGFTTKEIQILEPDFYEKYPGYSRTYVGYETSSFRNKMLSDYYYQIDLEAKNGIVSAVSAAGRRGGIY